MCFKHIHQRGDFPATFSVGAAPPWMSWAVLGSTTSKGCWGSWEHPEEGNKVAGGQEDSPVRGGWSPRAPWLGGGHVKLRLSVGGVLSFRVQISFCVGLAAAIQGSGFCASSHPLGCLGKMWSWYLWLCLSAAGLLTTQPTRARHLGFPDPFGAAGVAREEMAQGTFLLLLVKLQRFWGMGSVQTSCS